MATGSPLAEDEDEQYTDAQRDTPITTPRTQRSNRQAKKKEKRSEAHRSIQLEEREPLRRVDNLTYDGLIISDQPLKRVNNLRSYRTNEPESESESETETMVNTRHVAAKKKASAAKNKAQDGNNGAAEGDKDPVILPELAQLPPEQLQAFVQLAMQNLPAPAGKKRQAQGHNQGNDAGAPPEEG